MSTRAQLILAAVVLGLLKLTLFSVDQTQLAIVTQFGRPVRIISDPGLHVKWPFQARAALDRRLQLYDPPPAEFLTEDPKNLLVDAYICWRIAEPAPDQPVPAPLLFLQTVGDRDTAEMRLHDIVLAEVSAALGHTFLSALISTSPEELAVSETMAAVLESSRRQALRQYGIEVVDVAIKRLNFPEQTKPAVFDRMRAERDRIAKQYRAEGEREAMKIRAEADRQRAQLLADAYRQAEETRGRADAQATAIYAAAHRQDPQFYTFVRSLDAYRKFLNKETTVVLSSDSELLEVFTEGRPQP